MGWVNSEVTCERPTEDLVGADQRPQALVDLSIHAFASLLDRHHHEQAHTDTEQRHKDKADHRREDALPRAEVEIANESSAAVWRAGSTDEATPTPT